MSRAPSLSPSYARLRNLQREVHDLTYLALRKDPTRPERRARLQEIQSRPTDPWAPEGRAIAAAIGQLEADRAYVLEDHRISRGVIYDGVTDFTRPYRCMAEDLGPYVHQPSEHA